MRKFITTGLSVLILGCAGNQPVTNNPSTEGTQKDLPSPEDSSEMYDFWGLSKNPVLYNDILLSYNDPVKPWEGSYWPTYKGGLAYRWQTNSFNESITDQNKYKNYTKEEAYKLSGSEIQNLSPAEKYDLWQENWDPTSHNSLLGNQINMAKSASTNEGIPTWVGLCNGWSLASISEKEPKNSVTVNNSKGQKITFHPSDIKALASQYYFDAPKQYGDKPLIYLSYIGESCDETGEISSFRNRRCKFVHPMAFHLVLRNYSKNKQPFIMDLDESSLRDQIWNHPISGYKMKIGEPEKYTESYGLSVAPNTKYLVNVDIEISYITESEPLFNDVRNEDYELSKHYKYTLELNEKKEIIGGSWISSHAPDFIWIPRQPARDQIMQNELRNEPIIKYDKLKVLLDQ